MFKHGGLKIDLPFCTTGNISTYSFGNPGLIDSQAFNYKKHCIIYQDTICSES
ncbi:hypothetical protein KL86DYS1_20107 [uncultured Dysgonomonas sp.]|uniref:Uncharacterized protein n=1 Tax=uncultured Dysgonomonas sp. TaxID=206096 RepID=A0A212JKZ4_9BACT|nr:hypothetical protein KL86DYS1_20107 [uncultured Dysgonomonas sp.]